MLFNDIYVNWTLLPMKAILFPWGLRRPGKRIASIGGKKISDFLPEKNFRFFFCIHLKIYSPFNPNKIFLPQSEEEPQGPVQLFQEAALQAADKLLHGSYKPELFKHVPDGSASTTTAEKFKRRHTATRWFNNNVIILKDHLNIMYDRFINLFLKYFHSAWKFLCNFRGDSRLLLGHTIIICTESTV